VKRLGEDVVIQVNLKFYSQGEKDDCCESFI
jgi:hypothetical protein